MSGIALQIMRQSCHSRRRFRRFGRRPGERRRAGLILIKAARHLPCIFRAFASVEGCSGMAMSADEIQQLIRQRETLRGLLREAENGHTAAPSYDGMPPDTVDASIQATRAKLAKIEQLLAEQGGGAG
jgi:hypothetical protein